MADLDTMPAHVTETTRAGNATSASLYRRLIAARIRSDWQYRTSFLTLLASQTFVMALEFLAVVFVLQLVPSLGGWDETEVVFLYALATVPFAFADLTIGSVERTATHVQAGTFDRVLLRPQPILFQISAAEFELRRAGKLIPSLAIGIWAVANVDVDWTLTRAAVLVMALVCGYLIYAALWIGAASMSFWLVASREAMNSLTYGGQSANEYPLHLYRSWIRATLGWAVPLAFVSYVPSQWLLDADNPLGISDSLIWATPAVAAVAMAIALTCWTRGIRRYQSTGS